MIIVTGGAGFIGSALVWGLNRRGIDNIIIVDHLDKSEKWSNLVGLKYLDYYDKDEFIEMIIKKSLPYKIDKCFHMGACTSTTENDTRYLMKNNFKYSQYLAEWAISNKIKYIYASSAATYGDGSLGYDDDLEKLEELKPLNMYGYSKHLFDLWAKRKGYLNEFIGLKFFNIYGPNEYHKADMRSMILKGFEQIQEFGKIKLFKSYKKEYDDGEQKRDFMYVKDAVNVVLQLSTLDSANGIYNIGSGQPHSWNELGEAIFTVLAKTIKIEYIDMPLTLRESYQYFTKAELNRINDVGINTDFVCFNDKICDYITNYLIKTKYLTTLSS